MLDFISKSRAGEYGYYANHQRGTVDVYEDGTRYVYRKPWQGLKRFKDELRNVFGSKGTAHIDGQYPHYTITVTY